MFRFLKYLLLMPIFIFLWSCAAAGKVERSDLFLEPSKHVGEHVVIRGFMHYKFENRNLFPSKQHIDRQLCLPILIERSQREMIQDAEALDGAVVEIRGKLVYAAPPGMLAAFACKQVGIEVESIR